MVKRGDVMALALALLVSQVPGAALAIDGVQSGEPAASESPFLGGFLKETRIVYPLEVDGWEAVGERRYDAVELGASVRYQAAGHEDRWIDVFFYPVGVVPASHLQQAARVTLEEIRDAVGQQEGYTAADMGALRRFEVRRDGDSAPIHARSADLRIDFEQGAYHSALVLMIDRLYYVKGRYTVDADAMGRDEARRTLEQFMARVVRASDIGSVGDCWSPVPVEALSAEAGEPAGSRMSIASESDGGAWLLADRVVARDPAGESAKALSLLAMTMDGRLYPGCVGDAPRNPDVPEGHREIRLEYRAPTEWRRDGGRGVYVPRSGLG